MKKIISLFLIVIIGFIFRFYDLGSIPNSLNWDEVSWGYNAYSILLTGKDEYGEEMPLSFKAFSDYKQPVYVYLDAFSIKFFGLNPYAIRFPSAFFGTLSILSIYFLAKEIFIREKRKEVIGLIAALLFAISPWSIQFSRVAYEANVAIFFIVSGVAIFLYGTRTNRHIMSILGVLLLGISTYSYHSAKIFTPLIFVSLILLTIYRYKLSKKICSIFLLIFFITTVFWIIDTRTTARGRSVTFTSYSTTLLKDSLTQSDQDIKSGNTFSGVLHNRRYIFASKYLENYLSHFDPVYLFIKGDDARHHAPRMGIIYLICLPFILTGLYLTLKKRSDEGLFVLFWLAISPLASSLAIDSPNASRSLVMLPPVILLSSLGLTSVYESLKGKKKTILISLITVFYSINILYYINNYFAFTNMFHGLYWQYGYKEAIDFTRQFKKEKVYFLNNVDQAYMFYLFYEKYDPNKYLMNGGSKIKDNPCFTIDNRYFGECQENIHKGDKYVTTELPIKENDKLLKKIIIDDKNSVRIFELR